MMTAPQGSWDVLSMLKADEGVSGGAAEGPMGLLWPAPMMYSTVQHATQAPAMAHDAHAAQASQAVQNFQGVQAVQTSQAVQAVPPAQAVHSSQVAQVVQGLQSPQAVQAVQAAPQSIAGVSPRSGFYTPGVAYTTQQHMRSFNQNLPQVVVSAGMPATHILPSPSHVMAHPTMHSGAYPAVPSAVQYMVQTHPQATIQYTVRTVQPGIRPPMHMLGAQMGQSTGSTGSHMTTMVQTPSARLEAANGVDAAYGPAAKMPAASSVAQAAQQHVTTYSQGLATSTASAQSHPSQQQRHPGQQQQHLTQQQQHPSQQQQHPSQHPEAMQAQNALPTVAALASEDPHIVVSFDSDATQIANIFAPPVQQPPVSAYQPAIQPASSVAQASQQSAQYVALGASELASSSAQSDQHQTTAYHQITPPSVAAFTQPAIQPAQQSGTAQPHSSSQTVGTAPQTAQQQSAVLKRALQTPATGMPAVEEVASGGAAGAAQIAVGGDRTPDHQHAAQRADHQHQQDQQHPATAGAVQDAAGVNETLTQQCAVATQDAQQMPNVEHAAVDMDAISVQQHAAQHQEQQQSAQHQEQQHFGAAGSEQAGAVVLQTAAQQHMLKQEGHPRPAAPAAPGDARNAAGENEAFVQQPDSQQLSTDAGGVHVVMGMDPSSAVQQGVQQQDSQHVGGAGSLQTAPGVDNIPVGQHVVPQQAQQHVGAQNTSYSGVDMTVVSAEQHVVQHQDHQHVLQHGAGMTLIPASRHFVLQQDGQHIAAYPHHVLEAIPLSPPCMHTAQPSDPQQVVQQQTLDTSLMDVDALGQQFESDPQHLAYQTAQALRGQAVLGQAHAQGDAPGTADFTAQPMEHDIPQEGGQHVVGMADTTGADVNMASASDMPTAPGMDTFTSASMAPAAGMHDTGMGQPAMVQDAGVGALPGFVAAGPGPGVYMVPGGEFAGHGFTHTFAMVPPSLPAHGTHSNIPVPLSADGATAAGNLAAGNLAIHTMLPQFGAVQEVPAIVGMAPGNHQGMVVTGVSGSDENEGLIQDGGEYEYQVLVPASFVSKAVLNQLNMSHMLFNPQSSVPMTILAPLHPGSHPGPSSHMGAHPHQSSSPSSAIPPAVSISFPPGTSTHPHPTEPTLVPLTPTLDQPMGSETHLPDGHLLPPVSTTGDLPLGSADDPDQQPGKSLVPKNSTGPPVICSHGRHQQLCKDCIDGGVMCPHRRKKSRCSECGGMSVCVHGRQRCKRKECGGVKLCEHGRRKSRCKDCGGSSICEHNRRRTECRPCGGGSICQHGRERSKCKDCGGGSICQHGRLRSKCKDCGGGSICEHGRQRSKCKDCGGGSLCVHGRRKSRCKDCGGSGICEHSRRRADCRVCKGGSICEHTRQRSQCKACGGGSICEHGRVRSYCKVCKGGSICEHGKARSKCKECGGGSICQHGKERSKCKACGGGSICEHGRRRFGCKECTAASIMCELAKAPPELPPPPAQAPAADAAEEKVDDEKEE